jgi:FecR protein
MIKKHMLIRSMLVFIVILASSTAASAAAVGRLTLVEGQVDLLKEGNLPAVAVKVGDPVGPKDVIRTKSMSRAQITFIDDSTLTISPESRIAIEEFKFDEALQKRSAVLKIFQGLALAVVNKVIKAEEPDFVVKTHTAIAGVRGTEFGIRLSPNSSTILNFKGSTQVGNISPQMNRYNWNDGSNRWVLLKDMQGTTVARNMPPTASFAITPEDQMQFMRELATNAGSRGNVPRNLPQTAAGSSLPPSITTPGTPNTLNILSTVTVPPTLTPTPQILPPPPPAPPVSHPPVSPPPTGPSPPTGLVTGPS